MRVLLLFTFYFSLFTFFSCTTQKTLIETGKTSKKTETYQNTDEVKFKYFYLEGIKQLMLGNFLLGREMFQTCLELKPHSAATFFHLAKIYSNTGDINRAIVFAKNSVIENPSNSWYKIYLVKLHNSIEEYAESSKILRELIKESPEDAYLYFELADLYIFQNQNNEAISVLEDLEDLTHSSQKISDSKIQVYYRMHSYEKILKEIHLLLKIYPENIKYHGMLAETYATQGKLEEAHKAYRKLEQLAPDDAKSQISLIYFYLTVQNFAKALEIQLKAYANHSVILPAKVQLFHKVSTLNNEVYDEQIIFDLLNILLETHPNEKDIKELNFKYLLEKNDKNAARTQLLEILANDKTNFTLWRELLVLDTEAQSYLELITDAEEALLYYPNQPIVYYFLGFAHNKLKSYQEAISQLETSHSYIIDNDKFEQDVLLLLAESYYKNSELEKSFITFDKILLKNPANTLALNNYSFYLSLEKLELEKALGMAKLANELVLDNANFLDTYAWVLFQSKDYINSHNIIKEALNHGGNKSATIVEHHGDILFKLMQKDEALEQWKLAKSLGGNSTKLEEKISLKKYTE